MIKWFKDWIVPMLVDTGLFTDEILKATQLKYDEWIKLHPAEEERFVQEYNRGLSDGEAIYKTNVRMNLGKDPYFIDKVEKESREKLEALLTIIDERMIISFNEREKIVYLGGVRATPEQLANLKQEAEAIVQFDLWRVLNESPKKLAEKAMFVDDGVLPNQLLKGRAILYTLDTQNRILTILRSYSGK